MNPFLNPFLEWNPTQTRLARIAFLPRYARDKETGDRRQGEMTSVAFPTHYGAAYEAPAPTRDQRREAMR